MLSMILGIQVQIGLSLPGEGEGTSYPDDFQILSTFLFLQEEKFSWFIQSTKTKVVRGYDAVLKQNQAVNNKEKRREASKLKDNFVTRKNGH